MDLDFVSVHKNAKRELGQYPAILTSLLVNNIYIYSKKVSYLEPHSTKVCYYLCLYCFPCIESSFLLLRFLWFRESQIHSRRWCGIHTGSEPRKIRSHQMGSQTTFTTFCRNRCLKNVVIQFLREDLACTGLLLEYSFYSKLYMI